MVSHLFSYKHLFYTLATVAIAGIIFGEDVINHTVIDNNIFRIDSLNNALMAGKVAEIIDFEGEYQIQKGNQIITSKYIQEDNLIILKENSSVVFKLNDETQGKIIGPAEFIISKEQQKYRINLLEGKFLTIYNEKTQSPLEVVTDDFIVQQEKEEKVDIQIIKKENEVFVNNKGWNIKLIKEDKKSSQKEIIIEKEKTINIKENDITLLDNDEEIIQYIKENNLTHTFMIEKTLPSKEEKSDWNNNTGNVTDDFQQILNELSGMRNPLISWNGETVDFQIDIKETKKLPNEAQDHLLVTTFDEFFFSQEMEDIEQNFANEKWDKVERNQQMLAKEINKIISDFWLSLPYVQSFEDIANLGSSLKIALEEKYYISPSLWENMLVLIDKTRGFAEKRKNYKDSKEQVISEELHGSAGENENSASEEENKENEIENHNEKDTQSTSSLAYSEENIEKWAEMIDEIIDSENNN